MPVPTVLFKNLYAELGIETNASSDDIRRAYRKRALETHPDKLEPGANDKEKQEAERQFHRVHEAFEVLTDPVKRKAYDTRMNARTDPSLLSEEAKRRIRERKEWAQRQREESEKRMAAFRAELEREKREKQEALERMAKEAAMVSELVQDMYQLNPEFAARRQAVLQRKAERLERERAKLHKHPMQRPIHS
ncbi:DnaJ-domain-containing protein [Pholiota conissans]|uniref:DnaJ-domain-containing protein n=1 Tax=Pholiota conissans TaxID=109636 RepID=A0A9P5Z5M9_9AGAR|nr:DnaJ-domain-containing protein [Pholiota conissans]